MNNLTFSASLMCADYLALDKQLLALKETGIKSLHIDIMDGNFVPNLALNFDICRQIRQKYSMPMDIHLMVTNPEDYLDQLRTLKPEMVAFHIEAARYPIRLAEELKNLDINPGIALNPSTSINDIKYITKYFNYVLVMSVEPGFYGQKFIQSTYEKIESLKSLKTNDNSFKLAVDGNINVENAKKCISCGVEFLVCGTSSIFKKDGDLKSDTTGYLSNFQCD